MFIKCFLSDIDVLYPGAGVLKKLSSFVTNPSVRAAFLIRCCQFSPKFIYWLFRGLLLQSNSIDCSFGVRIGFGLILPHPLGIVFGGGVEIGNNVTIYQNVTLGQKNGEYPFLQDGVIVYPGAIIVGKAVLGSSCTVGALTFLDKSLLPGECFYAKK